MLSNGRLAQRDITLLWKILVTLAAALAGAVQNTPLSGQDLAEPGQSLSVMVGVKAGAITTGVHTELPAFLNTDWRTGVSAGVFAALEPSSNLILRAELAFAQRGFGFRMYQEGPGLIPGEAEVQSLEAALDLGLRVPWPGRAASVRVFAGPAFGYQLGCTVKGVVAGVRFEENCDEPTVGIDTRTVDVGASFGAGVDLYLRSVTVVMDGRYTYGLRNLNKSPGRPEDLSSRAWSFTVGVGWPFQVPGS
jgi:hypothetical protein